MRDTTSDFVQAKNAEQVSPIWLYRVSIDGNEANDVFMAEWDSDVQYFKDTDTPQLYARFPIRHEGLSESNSGRVDSVQVVLSNVSREFEAWLDANDGLRGRKVTIRQVFADALSNPSSHTEDVYTIDSVVTNENTATFTMTTILDVLDVRLPLRRYSRDYCHHKYKGAGCWIDNGNGTYTCPSSFSTTDMWLYMDQERYGTSPWTVGSWQVADCRFRAVNLMALNMAKDSLIIELKVDNNNMQGGVRNFSGDGSSYFFLSSGGSGSNGIKLMAPMSRVTVGTSWATFEFPLSAFTTTVGAGLNIRDVRYFCWRDKAAYFDSRIRWRKLRINRDLSAEDANKWHPGADVCNKTFDNCKLHNNMYRYGGFPSIPGNKVFRVG